MTDITHIDKTKEKQIPRQTFEAGDYFLIDGKLAELCQVGDLKFTLISCKRGNRYCSGQSVSNYRKITIEEIVEMVENRDITPVKSVKINYTI